MARAAYNPAAEVRPEPAQNLGEDFNSNPLESSPPVLLLQPSR